jgi:hypothetical protein
MGCTLFTCYFTKTIIKGTSGGKIGQLMSKKRENTVAKDKNGVISLGDSVFIVPRIRKTKKHAAVHYLQDRKWGSATIIEAPDENKFKVTFEGEVHAVNRWKLRKHIFKLLFKGGRTRSS